MSDQQFVISSTGDVEPDPAGPLTYDGEPLYAPDTVREDLFSARAFEQIKGQLAIEPDADADADAEPIA